MKFYLLVRMCISGSNLRIGKSRFYFIEGPPFVVKPSFSLVSFF